MQTLDGKRCERERSKANASDHERWRAIASDLRSPAIASKLRTYELSKIASFVLTTPISGDQSWSHSHVPAALFRRSRSPHLSLPSKTSLFQAV
ncbi:hypothetical protein L596_026600 [Steinernema carpocapsae]|uniref:Uncharacterized protein n=1 Tax=Steinernema carpocapsae TaxID=34508 RepID=A0A4U5M1V9_STECR|nr:hypothetical protein L596_026600 [Steinernema carpocapsae]